MSTPPAIWPPIETPEKLLREIGPVGTPSPDRIAELTAERDYLRAAIVEYDAAKLCLARFHPHHRTHTEAGQSAVRRVVDAEAALRALAEVPRG